MNTIRTETRGAETVVAKVPAETTSPRSQALGNQGSQISGEQAREHRYGARYRAGVLGVQGPDVKRMPTMREVHSFCN